MSTESDLKTHTPGCRQSLGATIDSSVPSGRVSCPPQNAYTGSDTE
jgi:hypothetical protein